MAALFDTGFLLGQVNVTAANAGDFAGASTQVVATGTAAPGAYGTYLVIACQGSNNANLYRFFVKRGGTKYAEFSVAIPKNDALSYVLGKMNPPQTVTVPINVPLVGTDTLEVNAEVAGNSDIQFFGKTLN